jgi:hypothetical protein
MANRYWVTGGDGNWNSTTNWSTSSGGASGASVPGSSDAALLDANSGAGTVTLDISPDIQTLTCTGFTGTLAFGTNTISLNSTGTIFTGATTMTVTGTPQIICTNATATARTISPQAVTEANSISFRVTAGTGTFTISSPQAVRDLDFTDGVNPTGFAGALASAANAITVYGSFKASTGMTQNAGTSALTFAATSGTKTIDTAGVTFDRPFTFNGVGGTWQLQAALTSGATRTCTLTNGTLDLVSYTLTTGIFSSSNSNVRTLAFGTGKIVVTGSAATIFTTGTATNLTVTGTRLVQAITNATTGTRTIGFSTSGGTESNTIDFEVTAGSDTLTLTGTGGAARSVNLTGFAGVINIPSTKTIYGSWDSGSATSFTGTSIITFASTGSQTIRLGGLSWPGGIVFNGIGGVWDMQDAFTSTNLLQMTNGTLRLKAGVTSTVGNFSTTGTNQKYLQSTLAGTQATLSDTSGTISTSYLSIRDINATGGAVWRAYTTNQNVDAGNNDGWDFSPQLGKYIYTRQKNKRILP